MTEAGIRTEQDRITCGAPKRRPTALEILALVMDALHVPRDTPLDEVPPLVALRCRPMDKTQLKELIVGGLEQGLAELGGKEPIDPRILAERVAKALHAVLLAQHQGLDREDRAVRLEDLTRTGRRVLAAICLLGARHSCAEHLSAITRLSSGRLRTELHQLEEQGVVTRVRRKGTGDGEGAWWPTPASLPALPLLKSR